ncbi:Uncharacterised protein [Candidatus Anstonella stagnisolia]|nr:Uncharacterised protein [Candidatus Anstonella stagnisolia]
MEGQENTTIPLSDNLKLVGTLEIFERPAPKTGSPKDPDYYKGNWTYVKTVKNLITNVGYNTIIDRLIGSRTYSSTTFTYFSWSNGTATPAVTDTAAGFLADGTTATKAVATYDSYDVGNKKQIFNCFLSSTDNTVASITKFALMNAASPTTMFNNLIFTAISKDYRKEFYFRYTLQMSQV